MMGLEKVPISGVYCFRKYIIRYKLCHYCIFFYNIQYSVIFNYHHRIPAADRISEIQPYKTRKQNEAYTN